MIRRFLNYIAGLSIKDIIGNIIWLLLIAFLLIFCIHPISGSSMYPTYENGQYAFCTRIVGELEQGDVVVAYAEDKNELIIKRVAAVPGDEIKISTDGNLYVNGEIYSYGEGDVYVENYVYYDGFEIDKRGNLHLTVGENEYFLLGDNHANSLDSRYWGSFAKNSIRQKVLCVFG